MRTIYLCCIIKRNLKTMTLQEWFDLQEFLNAWDFCMELLGKFDGYYPEPDIDLNEEYQDY